MHWVEQTGKWKEAEECELFNEDNLINRNRATWKLMDFEWKKNCITTNSFRLETESYNFKGSNNKTLKFAEQIVNSNT